jgi:cyclohexyl-isocyanide hydratase
VTQIIALDRHLEIGSLLFDQLDQIDLTGPFEVFSRLPNSTCRIYAKTQSPVRDMGGLLLTPDATLFDAPKLDVLHVPGGFGQEALMDDEEVLSWLRRQAAGALCPFGLHRRAPLRCGGAAQRKAGDDALVLASSPALFRCGPHE